MKNLKKLISICLSVFLVACSSVKNMEKDLSFKHAVQGEIKKRVDDPKSFSDVQTKIKHFKKYKSVDIKISDISIDDFAKVVFDEVLKVPYLISKDISIMNKRIDVYIPASAASKNLFSVVVAIMEKNGVEIEDVEGILVLTQKISKGDNKFTNNDGARVGASNMQEIKETADCIYFYKPVFSRSEDLRKSIKDLLTSESSQIIVNEMNNMIIFKTSEREKRAVLKLIRSLDEIQKQIAVDVTIAEVTLSNDLSYGFEGFLNSSLLGVNLSSGTSVGYGLTMSMFISDWLKMVVNMGEKRGLIRVKSNPYLIIADGSSSAVSIGSEYPILVQQKSSNGSSDIINQVDYRKTGIVININPVVSGENIHLKSKIELSEGQKNNISSINSPAIISRNITSNVIIKSGQSIIIGGLISESINKSDSIMPFMPDVRIGKMDNVIRTELIIILNVKILNENNMSDWFSYLKEKYSKHEIN